MIDRIFTTEKEPWALRLAKSFFWAFIGVFFILASFFLIPDAEKTYAGKISVLKQTRKLANTTSPNQINDQLNNKLIEVKGPVTSNHIFEDTELGVSIKGLNCFKQVLIYQWKETRINHKSKTFLGSRKTEVEYKYETAWVPSTINSALFKYPQNHINTGSLPYNSYFFDSKNLQIGNYQIDTSISKYFFNYEIANIISPKKLNTQPIKLLSIEPDIYNHFTFAIGEHNAQDTVQGQCIYIGKTSTQNPKIGDIIISYWAVPEAHYTILGQQDKNTIKIFPITDGFVYTQTHSGNFHTPITNKFSIINKGDINHEELFNNSKEVNSRFYGLWMPLICFLMMLMGFILVLGPAATFVEKWSPKKSNKIYKVAYLAASYITTGMVAFYFNKYNSIDNITIWDSYFLLLVAAMAHSTFSLTISSGNNQLYNQTGSFD